MKTIQSTIFDIKTKLDKNNQEYLILELENQENILVFAEQISSSKWDDLQIGEKYRFAIKKEKNNSNALVDYEKVRLKLRRRRSISYKSYISRQGYENLVDDLEKRLEQFEEKKTLFQEQEDQINYLELRVKELTNLIKNQKQKIINAFLQIFPEKELLQELIISHLELTELKKLKKPILKFRKEYEKLHEKLEEKLDEELMEKIEVILTNCEELVSQELELENKLKDKTNLIESQKQIIPQINSSEGEKNTKLETILKEHQKINKDQERELQETKQQSLQWQIELASAKGEIRANEKFYKRAEKLLLATKPETNIININKKNTQGFKIGDNNKFDKVSVDGNSVTCQEEITAITRVLSISSQTADSIDSQLAQFWIEHNFTSQQTKDWINIGLNPEDYSFASWLRDIKNLTSTEVLNEHQAESLRNEFQQSQQNQVQSEQLKTNQAKQKIINQKQTKLIQKRKDLIKIEKETKKQQLQLIHKGKSTKGIWNQRDERKKEISKLEKRIAKLQRELNVEQSAQIIQTNLPNFQNK